MMNRIEKLTLILLLLFGLQSWGQQPAALNIKGKVLDGKTKLPLASAGVSIISIADNTTLKTTLTDSLGIFSVSIAPGKYQIKIAFISYKPYVLEHQQLDKDIDLGLVFLQEDAKLLKSVNIVGEKSTVELNLDKKVFNVGKDLMSKGGTANDILNNVPSVNVDANGTVSLRGNGSVRVLINGKPSMLTANNGLGQVPANTIEKVEVITNPSARYEAQGGAGIINIVLKKNSSSGLNGSIQAGMGTPTYYSGNINLSYKTKKVNLFTNVSHFYRNIYAYEKNLQTTVKNGLTTILNQKNDQGRNDNAYSYYFGGDYYINEKNTLTGSFYHDLQKNNDSTNYQYRYYNGKNVLDSAISRFEDYHEPQNYNELELNYVKTFDHKDQKWTTSLRYDFWNDDENQNITQQKYFPSGNPLSHLNSRDIESSDDIYIQSDFVTTFSKSARFETGIRADLRAIRSNYSTHSNGVLLDNYTNKLYYDENIYAAYAQYANKFKRLSYLLGLRAELSDIGITDRRATLLKNKNYINLFPTLHLTYNLKENTDLQISYSRRINRPSFYQLNTFSGLSDTRNLVVGNPDLNPTYSNSFELAFLKKWGRFNLNPSVYYSHNKDYFQNVLGQTPEGFFVTTPVNLDYEDRYGLEISSTYNAFKWWRLSWDFNYYGFKQNGEFEGKEYGTSNKTWFTRISSRMNFPKSLAIEYAFNYRGKNADVQSTTAAQYRANIAISKDLFNDKLSVVLGITNLFDSQVVKQQFITPDYQFESEYKFVGRLTKLTLTYRFNRDKTQKDRLPAEN
ncbi:outer membrane beta-barrel family protein [Pedobacter sp. UBA5917]|jgi:outer membrane receptor protein involved in Fe transport|uniref:outer membrane beta-barrel family protein n=1 Tax=Pedobacter sp. UBA5917 TaxID=1947061 RepID=UPI0025D30F9D|nr:outer membrane beta-barrel family protein [Pedobacter sp. UBA5917]